MELEKTAGLQRTYQVDCFEKEFEKVTAEKNPNGRYHKWLRKELIKLEEFGVAALKFENFEPLPGTDPKLFSIRYPHSKINPRVIYVYINGGEIYLLTAFKEGSKNTNSDYAAAIKISQNRLKYLW